MKSLSYLLTYITWKGILKVWGETRHRGKDRRRDDVQAHDRATGRNMGRRDLYQAPPHVDGRGGQSGRRPVPPGRRDGNPVHQPEQRLPGETLRVRHVEE